MDCLSHSSQQQTKKQTKKKHTRGELGCAKVKPLSSHGLDCENTESTVLSSEMNIVSKISKNIFLKCISSHKSGTFPQ